MRGELHLTMKQDLTLRDSVFETLRSAILRGYFEPGEHLTEISLAELLGVSRTPIREALQFLEREHLVILHPRRGAEVAGISAEDVRDEMEIRSAMEMLAIEKACGGMRDDQLRELERTAAQFALYCKIQDAVLGAEEDEKFHQVIANASGNKRLIYLLEIVREQLYRYRLEVLRQPENHPRLIREHEEIVAAMRERNVEKAKDAARQHVLHQCDAILRNLEKEKETKS